MLVRIEKRERIVRDGRSEREKMKKKNWAPTQDSHIEYEAHFVMLISTNLFYISTILLIDVLGIGCCNNIFSMMGMGWGDQDRSRLSLW